MKTLLLIVLCFLILTSVKAQTQFPNGNYKIEYKNEVGGKEPYTVILYKKDNMYKLVRSGKHGTFTTLIDFEADKYYDITTDKKTKGNKYNKINYAIITSMWQIYFKGMANELKQYQKLPDKQTVAGKECDVYDSGKLSIMNSTSQYFFCGDLMLKTEKPALVIEAVSIVEDPVFEENEFEIPAEIMFEY